MAAKLDLILLKTVRLTGWPLFVMAGLYFVTGFALCGRHGFGAVMDPEAAKAVHSGLNKVMLALVLAHSLPAIYLALVRWGWIRR